MLIPRRRGAGGKQLSLTVRLQRVKLQRVNGEAAGTGRRLESHWYTLQGIDVSEHRTACIAGCTPLHTEHTAAQAHTEEDFLG